MNKLLRLTLISSLASCLLYSCSKTDSQDVAPQPKAATGLASDVSSASEKMRDAWDKFVTQVERGIRTDPFGQYVSKDTQVPSDGFSTRPNRAQVKVESRNFKRVTKRSQDGQLTTYYTLDDHCPPDAIECTGDGSGGGTVFTSTFTSSETIGRYEHYANNPSDYITDLELAKSSYSSVAAQPGYYKLDLDLNKGAGGKYIYLCFTRGQADDHGYNEHPWDRWPPITMVKASATSTGFYTRPNGYADIFNPTGTPVVNEYKSIDLNDGAGGQYIHAFLSKEARPSTSTSQQNASLPSIPFIQEVGIVAGNHAGIRPPDGWFYDPTNLNEGAGGDYIYFCWKYVP